MTPEQRKTRIARERKELALPEGRYPRNVAIIMDGNGRWAKKRGLPRVAGHQEGANSVEEIVTRCAQLGIGCLTLYSFSMENWKRPSDEVQTLMGLYARYLVNQRPTMMEYAIRFRHLGRRKPLPEDVLEEMDKTIELTAGNEGMELCVALNYGSRVEITDAVQTLAAEVAAGRLDPEAIDEDRISGALYTAGLPDPDLLIRTAGQMRISNFLLWQISYTELYVTDVHWPDFRTPHLHNALGDYATRLRRFGDIQPTTSA